MLSFDRVQHDVLMSRVSRKVHDQRLLRLIGHYLRAGVMVEGILETVAISAYEGSSPDETWRRSGHGDQARSQPQELLADVSNTRHALRND